MSYPAPEPNQRPVDFLEEALESAEGALRAGTGQHFLEVASTAHNLIDYCIGIAAEGPESRLRAHHPVDQLLSEVQAEEIRKGALTLSVDSTLWPPWVRFAVEFILMERAVDRLQPVVQRYADLRAILLDRPIPHFVNRTLTEVVELYLWGFDAQAVALACACFETVAKEVLLAVGRVTEAQLRRERPGAEELRRNLTRAGLLSHASPEIEYLVQQRNVILHGQRPEEPIERVSRRCLAALVEAFRELHPAWPRQLDFEQ